MSDPNPIYNPYGGVYNDPGTANPVSGGPGVTQRVADAASQAKDKASELGRTAVDKIDQQRESAASALSSAASTLRSTAAGPGKVADMANNAAAKLENTADYFRRNRVSDMTTDLEGAVRRNPGPSIVAALAVGFLLGSAMRRD